MDQKMYKKQSDDTETQHGKKIIMKNVFGILCLIGGPRGHTLWVNKTVLL